MNRWWAALSLLTALPVPGAARLSPAAGPSTVALYPAVGLLVGAIQAGTWWVAGRWLPSPVAAAAALAAGLVVTGGLHWDGWMDCCDGLFAPLERERRLEALQDPHVGAFAVLGALAVALLQWSALSQTARAPALLLAAGPLSRWAVAAVVAWFPAAKPDGLGAGVREGVGTAPVLVATAVGLAAAVAVMGTDGLVAAAAALGVGLAFGWWANGVLHGLTGDVYGAVQVLAETAVLLAGLGLKGP